MARDNSSASPRFAQEFTPTMPDASLPLDDLTQQIAQRQSELERLRREYETRQARLADLGAGGRSSKPSSGRSRTTSRP